MFKLPSFQIMVLIALMIASVSCVIQIRLLLIKESVNDEPEKIKSNKKRVYINILVIVLIGLLAFGSTYLS
ncbi:hypothetical protein CJ194_03965 [Priestia megaterium]|uniref:hypothetical protein n=1 Tax=Priestia megaterium TaxID=1404 RepID=UPI000BFA3681|nr:hypothetical protein [Priestia megaterium]PFK03299.1 hypothetical protein COI96_03380 [Priestia megaterium]PMD10647.1 hypothetical protein CJ194_03965 [Priestia megaterium]